MSDQHNKREADSQEANAQFVRETRAHLRRWDSALPPDVTGRLRAARREALAGTARPRRTPFKLWQTAAAGMAVVAAIIWLAVGQLHSPDGKPMSPRTSPMNVAQQEAAPALAAINADDWSMITSGDDVLLYEDLDFLLWLDESDDDARG